MAVPKKRTSKAKKRTRKSAWKQRAIQEAKKSLSLSKAVSTRRTHFVYRKDSSAKHSIPRGFGRIKETLTKTSNSVE
nr:ribosomal protein L32 [Interfilum sp. SAG 2147]WKT06324.1 ribosomal protein L32 [Interfilum sp. SAG 2147]